MSLFNSLSQLFQRDAQHLESFVIPVDHIAVPPPSTGALGANEGYFRLWVTQMFLAHDRNWFKDWYPVVQALTIFSLASRPNVEIAQVAGPGSLEQVDPKNLGRIINRDYALTPLIPFGGGIVQIQAGLIAMPDGDLLRRFLEVMGSFASLITVPQVSAVLGMADTVSQGVDQLLGGSDKQMVLGYQQTFVSKGGGGDNDLASKYILLTSAPAGSYSRPDSQIWIKDGAVWVGPDLPSASLLDKVNYMLLRFETRQERDDWESLTSINDPWTKAINALSELDASGNPKVADADLMARIAIAAALNSIDLTTQDKPRIARTIRDKYTEYKDMLLGISAPTAKSLEAPPPPEAPTPPTLTDVAITARGASASPVTTEELLRGL